MCCLMVCIVRSACLCVMCLRAAFFPPPLFLFLCLFACLFVCVVVISVGVLLRGSCDVCMVSLVLSFGLCRCCCVFARAG